MYQTLPILLHQDTVFIIVRSLIYQLNCNLYKKNRTLLLYNPKTTNMYLDGSETISTFHWFKAKHTQNEIFDKHAKEGYWTSQDILRFLEILGFQSLL